MAIHENQWTMAIAVIDEYLRTSQLCLEETKPDGGCLGYSATLLLFCVVNAMGTYLGGDGIVIENKEQQITKGEPFRIFNHPLFGLDLTQQEIKQLERSYRNALVHSATIEAGAMLFALDGEVPFEFISGHVWIRLCSFHRRVEAAWALFPKQRIEAWEKNGLRTPRRAVM